MVWVGGRGFALSDQAGEVVEGERDSWDALDVAPSGTRSSHCGALKERRGRHRSQRALLDTEMSGEVSQRSGHLRNFGSRLRTPFQPRCRPRIYYPQAFRLPDEPQLAQSHTTDRIISPHTLFNSICWPSSSSLSPSPPHVPTTLRLRYRLLYRPRRLDRPSGSPCR